MNEYSVTNGEYNRTKPPSPSPGRRTPVACSPAPPARVPSASPAPPARRGSSPPKSTRSPSPKIDSYNPSGQGYYTKYSTVNSNSSYSSNTGPPASFPTCPSPAPPGRPTLQTPPKRVDDLMTELSEFDPSIQHTSFNEQAIHTSSTRHQQQVMNKDL